MGYKHILVAVDLTEDTKTLIAKAVSIAAPLESKISFIHIDVNYADLYTGLIDVNMAETQYQTMESSLSQLKRFTDDAQYPVEHTLIGSGDLSNEICETIEQYGIDLVVTGHHQDFWSKIISSTRQLLNCTPIDMLIVPLKDD